MFYTMAILNEPLHFFSSLTHKNLAVLTLRQENKQQFFYLFLFSFSGSDETPALPLPTSVRAHASYIKVSVALALPAHTHNQAAYCQPAHHLCQEFSGAARPALCL